MVGLKVDKKAAMTPSPGKKDKKLKKFKGIGSPAEDGKKVKTPAKPTNGAEAKPKPSTPGTSPNGTPVSKKKKGKNYGAFGERNKMKDKDDVFSKMVKEKAVKEHISPSFLKKLNKSLARLPAAGKRFVFWLVNDVKYKVKFLPIIEEVFKTIKQSEVLPLPASGKAPMTKSEKNRAKIAKRKAKGLLQPKKEKTGNEKSEKGKTEKRKINEVSTEAPAVPDSQKKKKMKKEKPDSSSLEPANASLIANEGSLSAKKKNKKEVSSPKPNASFSANESIVAGSGKKKKKNKKSLGKVSDN